MTLKPKIILSLGIDPKPKELRNFEGFSLCVDRHKEFLKRNAIQMETKVLKIQLAFFLSFGSRGLALLENFVGEFKNDFRIIIDGKFNDISSSFQAYLDFVFVSLGAQSLTINPFLGEKTIARACEVCAKHVGSEGRVYVLARTSESSSSDLSYLQNDFQKILTACVKVREELFAGDKTLLKIPGAVIAAQHADFLSSSACQDLNLSLLSPGLGAQGADWNVVSQCLQSCLEGEVTFPVSRGIFQGGQIPVADMMKNYTHIQKNF